MNTPIVSRFLRAVLFAGLSVGLSSGPTSSALAAAEMRTEVKNLAITGGVEEGKARLVIDALFNRLPAEKEKVLYATTAQHSMKVSAERLDHAIALTIDILQGEPAELTLGIQGAGEIREVTGAMLQDWSVRQQTNGQRVLVLRPRKADGATAQWTVNVTARQEIKGAPGTLVPLTLAPAYPALFSGYVRIEAEPELDLRTGELTGLVPIQDKFLPESMRPGAVFINTGRGRTVAEIEMIVVMRRRDDLTALLDVTFPEPTEAGSPLRSLSNVLVTSHIAGVIHDEVYRLADLCISEFDRYVRGEPLQPLDGLTTCGSSPNRSTPARRRR